MTDSQLEISVERIYKLNNDKSSLKAFADICVNNVLLIKSIRVINGKKGLFVSMPMEQAKDKKWYESVKCLNEEIRHEIVKKVMEAYEDRGK